MLKTVINDLRAFLFTLLILIFFFGNALVILGIGIDPTTLMNPEEKAAYDLEIQNEEAESQSDSDSMICISEVTKLSFCDGSTDYI